jgi:phage terminase large subunit
VVGQRVHVLDYLESEGEHVPYYAKQLRSMEYVFGEHLLPHDADTKGMGQPLSIRRQLESLGVRPTRVVPRDTTVEHGIQAVRALFPRLVFDRVRCRLGLERLASYRKERDEKTHMFRAKPRHDEASHGADALRTLAVGLRRDSGVPRQTYAASATTDVLGDRRRAMAVATSRTAAW